MTQVKGSIEAVSCKEGNDHPTYGKSYVTSIKVNGEWYGAFTKKTADELSLVKGKLVSFTFSENGKYKNFDPKSLAVSASQAAPAAPATASRQASYSGNGNAGIKVGHAINNAVQLAIAKNDISLKAIHGHAVDILALSVKLESQFDIIVKSADTRLQKANAGTPAAEAAAPAAVGKAAATKPKRATKAAPAPTPPPVEEVEPQQEEAPEVEAPAVEPSFDEDDIPF